MRLHTLNYKAPAGAYAADSLMRGQYREYSAEPLRLAFLLLAGYGAVLLEAVRSNDSNLLAVATSITARTLAGLGLFFRAYPIVTPAHNI